MNTVTVTQSVPASPDAVREEIRDVVPFMLEAGFDDVQREGDRLTIRNSIGLLTLELVVDIIDDPECVLAYGQHQGIFESMRTCYTVESAPAGTTVRAEPTFALDVAVVGDFLDATVVERQRRRELTAQLEYLVATLG